MTEDIQIKSNQSTATISLARGGRVTACRLMHPQLETLNLLWDGTWTPGEGRWAHGGNPVLFPFAGRVFENDVEGRYTWDGIQRTLPLHGLVHNRPCSLVKQTDDSCVWETMARSSDLAAFPFAFGLRSEIKIAPDSLIHKITVVNLGLREMPVALGFHPYFDIPTSARIECEATSRYEVEKGRGARPVSMKGSDEPLSSSFSRNGILGPLKRPQVSCYDADAVKLWSMGWTGDLPFQFLTFWRPENGPFHCIEPWMGLPDAIHNQTGLKTVSPHGSAHVELTITTAADTRRS